MKKDRMTEPTADSKSIYTVFAVLTATALIAAMAMSFFVGVSNAGPAVILFWICLGITFRGTPSLKGYTYSAMIFAAVSAALYYPSAFVELNGFKLSGLITPLIQLIMFGMGTSMSTGDFVAVVKSPKAVLIGITAHFMIMPLLGFTLAKASGFPLKLLPG